MSNETREAFFLGQEANRENRDISPYELDDPLTYYWIKGRLDMKYRGKKELLLLDQNNMLLQKVENDKNKYDGTELEDTKLKLTEMEEEKADMQSTINALSAKLSKVAKVQKRKINKVGKYK
jgi:hypothetical protein